MRSTPSYAGDVTLQTISGNGPQLYSLQSPPGGGTADTQRSVTKQGAMQTLHSCTWTEHATLLTDLCMTGQHTGSMHGHPVTAQLCQQLPPNNKAADYLIRSLVEGGENTSTLAQADTPQQPN